MASKRGKPKTKRKKQQDCIVQWDDGSQNVVCIGEIEHVNKGSTICVGSRIKMLFKKKWYFGEVIEIEGNPNKSTIDKLKKDESTEIKGTKEQEENKTSIIDQTEKQKDDQISESSEKTSSSYSPPDDTDEDPDYDQSNYCCEVVLCREDVFAACDKCLALMCFEHFENCKDLDCSRGHLPKMKNKLENQEVQKELTIEDKNEFNRTIGTQTQTTGKAHKSTQTRKVIISEEGGNVTLPLSTRDDGDISPPTPDAEDDGGDRPMMLPAEPKDVSSNTTPYEEESTTQRRVKGKQYFCIYCKKLVLNFARHLLTNHPKEEEVVKISTLPKGSSKRMEMINIIRGQGALYFNTSPEISKGEKIVKRRKKEEHDGYTPCPICKNFFKKGSLHKHYKACAKTTMRTPRNLQVTSLALAIPTEVKGVMEDWLKNEVLPGISNKDNVRDFIISDQLLVDFGNYLCVRHRTNKHLTNMVRQKLRQMAKLTKLMKELDPEIQCLEQALTPGKYDIFMKAVNIAAGYNDTDSSFRAPSVVTALGLSAQDCANIMQRKAIKMDDLEMQKKAENWLKLYKHEFYYGVGKSALNEGAKKQWNKPRLLPTVNDVMKLNQYLKNSILSAKKALTEKFSSEAFKDLNKCTMLEILLFNRKRIGEVEKLLISDYKNKHNIQRGTDIYENLTRTEKIVASRFQRMEVRGKLGRPVSLLINENQIENIDLILTLRNQANVSPENPYVFGRYRKQFYEASPALRTAAWNCGASNPKVLTGTRLRKELATMLQILNFTENDLSVMADFMGHNINTHRNFYRLPNEVTHLARISQVLLSLEDGTFSKYKGKSLVNQSKGKAKVNQCKHRFGSR